jgi:S1-C subfamily serine protease
MNSTTRRKTVAALTGAAAALAAAAAFALFSSNAIAAAPAGAASAPEAVVLNHHGPFTGTKTITFTAVISVVSGGPAEQAGLKTGDAILAVDGQNISSTKTLANVLGAKKPGDPLALQVQSADGTTRSVTATLGDNPNKPGTAYLGITYGWPRSAKGPDRGFGRKATIGQPMIANVQANSPAAQAGLQAGDVINEVNGNAVGSVVAVKDAVGAAKPGDKLTLKVMRGSASQTIEVTLGENPNQAGAAYLGVTLGRGRARPAPTPPGADNTNS